MRFALFTSPIIGNPLDRIKEIHHRMLIIIVVAGFFGIAGASIKLVYWDVLYADAGAIIFGLLAILPLSVLPSLWSMRRSIKNSLLP